MYKVKPPELRFWKHVNKEGPLCTEELGRCWLWTGWIVNHGYGVFSLRPGQRISAHRFAYELLIGPILPGLVLYHRCPHSACVNPRHLYVALPEVTQKVLSNGEVRHVKPPRKIIPAADRFWANVDKNGPVLRPELGPCWLWCGSRDSNDYGRFFYQGKLWPAHRFAYFLAHGECPDDLFCCHRCDHPRCVRDTHLFLGSNTDNMRDAAAKGRTAKGARSGLNTHPEKRPYGERQGHHKLTWKAVTKIRQRYAAGTPVPALARRYHVNVSTIYYVLRHETWKEEFRPQTG